MMRTGVLCLALAFQSPFAEKQRIPTKPNSREAAQVKAGELDKSAIRALYIDGEFDMALELLERARQNGQLRSHADSIFAFKHLGVMYAAKYETQELGKRYMYQLLSIQPTVGIMDMYASDMIYMIFKNVKTEYELRLARPEKADSGASFSSSPKSDTGTILASKKASDKRTWPYWTAGAVLLAAGAGFTAYLLLEDESSMPTHFDAGF